MAQSWRFERTSSPTTSHWIARFPAYRPSTKWSARSGTEASEPRGPGGDARAESSSLDAGVGDVGQPAVIDGKADEAWNKCPVYNLANSLYAKPSSDKDLSATYQAMWDKPILCPGGCDG